MVHPEAKVILLTRVLFMVMVVLVLAETLALEAAAAAAVARQVFLEV
jgi:hypothetical protein